MAVPKSTTTQAVDALLKWKSSQSDSEKLQLLPQDDFIYLILTLKKIPQKGGINGARTNPHKIALPHPLLPPSSLPELCLIIDDRPNSKLTSEIAKKKIKADGIPVTKVIKLSKLKTDYKPFESKRKLCDSYEMFFADKRVIPLLPKLLGKHFFKKKKLPLPVDLSHRNWKEQIERGCSSGLLFLKTGTCSVIRIAKASLERDEIVENVCAAVDGVVDFVPKKWAGVRSLHLKFSESVALPLYQALPDIKLRIGGSKGENVDRDSGGEIVVRDEDMGKKKRSKKVRIHEVNHDGDDNELGSEDEGEKIENVDELASKKKKTEFNEEESGKEKNGGSAGKKKRNGIEVQGIKNSHKRVKKTKGDEDGLGSDQEDHNTENDDVGAELVGRKRKGGAKENKPAKKSGKEKKGSNVGSGKKKKIGNEVQMNDFDKSNEKSSRKLKGGEKKLKGGEGKKEKKKGRVM